MAFQLFKTCGLFLLQREFPYLNSQKLLCGRNFISSLCPNPIRTLCDDSQLNFESSSITHHEVTPEIQFYRDSRNRYSQVCFSDAQETYGPPLAILLPWNGLRNSLLQKIIEFYGEKGFDVLTIRLTAEQFFYPCVSGNAMNVVSDLLEYLNETHKYRPYVFHGFSVGVYIFGEVLAQFSDQYEIYRTVASNVKGCLWDSPVDFLTVKQNVGKFFYPKNWFKRLRCNRAVKRHFKNHYHDSVTYWLRSRENFSNPIIKIPNVFFLSYADLLSNPCSIQNVQQTLECNGVPIFVKAWWDSEHGHHFEKYCYEYIYGMILFFNLCDLFPDDSGKYRCNYRTTSVTNLRLKKAARDSLCPQ